MLKKTLISCAALLMVSACTTPMTVMKNQKTGQVVDCGGNVSSSLAGGVVGYHIQKSHDKDCVLRYREEGFEIIDTITK